MHNQRLKKPKKAQRGQSLIEYLMLVALIGIGSLAILRSVSQNLQVRFAQVVTGLGGKVEGSMQAAPVTSNAYKKKDLGNFLSGATTGKNNSSNKENDDDSN